MNTKDRINHYEMLVSTKSSYISEFIEDNEGDKGFLVFVKLHVALSAGFISGMRMLQQNKLN